MQVEVLACQPARDQSGVKGVKLTRSSVLSFLYHSSILNGPSCLVHRVGVGFSHMLQPFTYQLAFILFF